MKHDVKYQELNDEQLELVVGGTHRRFNKVNRVNVNVAVINQHAVNIAVANHGTAIAASSQQAFIIQH
jgi:metal-dependent hydrolase (beta-lactamase superfamily II)